MMRRQLALAAFLLFSAYLDEIYNYSGHRITVDLAKPEVFVGAMLGAMLVLQLAHEAMMIAACFSGKRTNASRLPPAAPKALSRAVPWYMSASQPLA